MFIVNFIGRLGRDAEKHDSKNGSFVSYSIAIDEWNPETKENETIWIRVTDGSERTMNMLQYLKKGTMLQVVGTERVSIYNGQNGQIINRDVRALHWDFVKTGKQDSETTATQTDASTTTAAQTPKATTVAPPPPPPANVQAQAVTGSFAPPKAAQGAYDDLPF